MNFIIDYKNQVLYPEQKSLIVANSVNFVNILFVFHDDITGLAAVATFYTSEHSYDVQIVENTALFPTELLKNGNKVKVTVSLYGDEGNLVIRSKAMNDGITVFASGEYGGDDPEAYTPELWEQVEAHVAEVENKIPKKTSQLENDSDFTTAEDVANNYTTKGATAAAVQAMSNYTDGKVSEEAQARDEALKGYEKLSNKVTKLDRSDDHYPSAKAVQTAINNTQTVIEEEIGDEVSVLNGKITTAKQEANTYTDGKVAEEAARSNRFAGQINDALLAKINQKQNKIIAGKNITIEGDVISAEGGGSEYTFADGIKESGGRVTADTDVLATNEHAESYTDGKVAAHKTEVGFLVAGLQSQIDQKQAKLVSGENVKTVNGEPILGNGNIEIGADDSNYIIITEQDVTVELDATKGVAPYNTSYGYTNITINGHDDVELATGLTLAILCSGDLVVASANRNTRFRFGTSGTWIPFYQTTSIANGNTFLNTTYSRIIYYSTNIISTGAFHPLTDNNTTYTPASLGFGYGTCTTSSTTAAKVVSLSSYALTTGGIVSVRFTNNVNANATMNINSKGAKNIFYNNAKITNGVIKAGDIATFVYDGTQYRLIAINTDITNKQDKLVSGTNIKTINGESILGAGDLTIGGGDTPTVTIDVSQFIGENEVQLTDEQYDILTSNTFVKIDATAVGLGIFGVQCGTAWSGVKYAQIVTAIWSTPNIVSGRFSLFEFADNKVMTIMQDEFPTINCVQEMIEEYVGVIENGAY